MAPNCVALLSRGGVVAQARRSLPQKAKTQGLPARYSERY